jgi:RimJ/RimL family protein N-acetyltransferase
MRISIQTIKKPSVELFRDAIKYVNRNLKEGAFDQIATNAPIPLREARKWREAMLSGHQVCAIALVSGKVIGVSHLNIGHGRRAHTATLAITVDKYYRRQGVATALMTSITNQAKEKGIRVIIAEPSEVNVAAINLLKRFGFKEAGRIRNGFRRDNGSLKDLVSLQLSL